MITEKTIKEINPGMNQVLELMMTPTDTASKQMQVHDKRSSTELVVG